MGLQSVKRVEVKLSDQESTWADTVCVRISKRNPLTPTTLAPKHFRLNFELQAPDSVSSLQ